MLYCERNEVIYVTHFMKLRSQPFENIRNGSKTIELRLNDEKRRKIRVGDVIVFLHGKRPNQYLQCTVKALHASPSFAELFHKVNPLHCGFREGDALTMGDYYSPEEERTWGVLGIEIQVTGYGRENSPIAKDGGTVLAAALDASMPDTAVKKALEKLPATDGRLLLVAVGKAAWQMAYAAYDVLGANISGGIVITKHGHSRGQIGNLMIREAGHPVPDDHTYSATEEALALTAGLAAEDRVLFLLSGGGSALFEKPLLPCKEMEDITRHLLACGAEITEINTLRKRFSAVKGGRFAEHIFPAKVFSVILSDIIGDPVDMIASGPAYPDSATAEDALKIAERYALPLSEAARELLAQETPKELPGVETMVTGSVKELCAAVEKKCAELGYQTHVLTDTLSCEARAAGEQFAVLAREHAGMGKQAFIMGGETVVKLIGNGLGGRNQEMALAAAIGLDGLACVWFGSLGSDGTDGPTDAAGGCASGDTLQRMREKGVDATSSLDNNDAFHALQASGNLLFTGPTGTNVNDVSVLLMGE